ncbi:MAG: acyloxyacyl hydrolase [Flavobacteriaceae bacterium]|nr:acyloxyacyl hydrolase [Flavobacteriaceae bacterium]
MKNIARSILFVGIMMSFCENHQIFAQENSTSGIFKTISITGHSGAHIYSGVGLTDEVQYGYTSLDVRFSWQPSTDTEWANDTGYAAYGFGYYSSNVGDPQVFGKPNALYGFVNFFLSNSRSKHIFEISPALGITYNLEKYDPESNPTNDAIGASMAVYFSVHFGGAYKLNRELDLLYGIDFTHFSNGRTFTPNYGLNLFGLNVGMRYNFNQYQRQLDRDPYTTNVVSSRFLRPERPKTPKNKYFNSIDFYAAIGTTQNEVDQGTSKRYGVFSGVVDYRHYFNKMHGVTAGLDLFFDNSLAEKYEDTSDRYLLGVHGGYDFMFWRMAIRVQVGTYLTPDRGKGSFYLRPAFQYNFANGLFAQFGLKTTDGAAADWLEFGIGWRPFKW